MPNTGKKIYTDLIEVYVDNGEPTGNTMPNDPSSPFYIPPVDDFETCPITSVLKIVTEDYLMGSQVKIENSTDTYTLIRNSDDAGENSISIEDGYYLATVSVPRNRAKTIEIDGDVRINTGPYDGGLWVEYFNNVSFDITVNVTIQDLIYEGDDSPGGYFCEQDGTTTTSTSSTTTTTTTRSLNNLIRILNSNDELAANLVEFTVKQNGSDLITVQNPDFEILEEHPFAMNNLSDLMNVYVTNNAAVDIIVRSLNTLQNYTVDGNGGVVILFDFSTETTISLELLKFIPTPEPQ